MAASTTVTPAAAITVAVRCRDASGAELPATSREPITRDMRHWAFGGSHGDRGPAPHHDRRARRATHDRFLHDRPWPQVREEDGQLRRSDDLPPVLRRREGHAGYGDHVLRVAGRAERPP